jgi:hypothetical protein
LFDKTTFSGSAFFHRTTFPRNANFSGAAFADKADFSEATFLDTVSFSKATFGGNVDFGGAMFSNQVDFEAVNSILVRFSRTQSLKYLFQTSATRSCARPPSGMAPHGHRLQKTMKAIQQHIYANERLKAEMERLKKHEEEQFFFAKELRARRAREPRWLKDCPTTHTRS